MAGSNGTRMAGEELSKADQRARARERIGNDPDRLAERLSGIDREAYDFDGYTDKEINMAMQGGTFDENDYARLTGNPIEEDPPVSTDPVDEPPPETNPEPTPGDNPGPPSPPPPSPPGQTIMPPVYGWGPGGQNINQDNDQTSNITGDNNNVNQNQDNSINGYGGNSSWKDAWMKDYFA